MRISVAIAAACFSLTGICAADEVRAAIRKQTNIPAQELRGALQTLAKERSFQIIYFSEEVNALKTQGAVGEFTADEALTKILSGTGLSYSYLDEKTVTVFPLPSGDRPRSTSANSSRHGVSESRATPSRRNFWGRVRLAQADQTSVAGEASPAASAGFESRPAPIEEVVVTAQKRLERLQDVPVPVAALSATELAENGRVLLKDYYARVPGLSLAPNYGGEQRLAIRGISTGGSAPTVGITVDDVPYGSSTDWGGGGVVPDIDPGDLARIEVLRGPQGTLYGANSMGGLIKYVTVDPSTDGYSGRVEVGTMSVRNGDGLGHHVRASANVPVNDTFALRAGGFMRQDPGYIDNPVTGADGVNEVDARGGLVSALWQPGSAFSLKLSSLYQHSESEGSSEIEIEPGLKDLQQNFLPGTGAYERKVQAHSAVVKAEFSHADFTSITGYNVNDFVTVFDRSFQFRGFAQSAFGVQGTAYHIRRLTKKFTQEVRLAAPEGRKLEWLIGGFYTSEESPYIVSAKAVDTASLAVAGAILDFDSPRDFDEKALFGGLTYHFTDRFDVQVGGRQSESRLVVHEYTFDGPYAGLVNIPPLNLRATTDSDAFTYLLTPRFKLSSDLMMYARFASGYRPGAVNINSPGIPPGFDADRTENYEIGLKGEFLDNRLSVDASIYYIDWSDIQLVIRDLATGLSFTSNGGKAKSQGVELSVSFRPFSGTTISGWAAYNDAVLTEDFPPGPAAGFSGDRLSGSPRESGYLSVEQEFPVAGQALGFVGGELTYVGERISVFQPLNTPREVLPAYAQTDLRAGLKYDSWTAGIFVNNVTDKRGVVNGGRGYLPSNAYIYIQPRTMGLSLSKSF